MIPDPLHPAVVHLPMAIVVLLPLAALAALLAIRRGASSRAAWLPIAFLAVLLAGSTWVATETGEGQEEAVEEVVPESAIHDHEEAAELFLLLAAGAALLFAAGLLRGRAGDVARHASLVATLVLLVAGIRVGHSGGALVYTHGAASAYAAGSTDTAAAERSAADDRRGGSDSRTDGDDDHEER